jgi:hypothetical protein
MHLCEDLEQSFAYLKCYLLLHKAIVSCHAGSASVSDQYIVVEQMTSSSALSKFAQVPGLVTDGEVPGLYLCWDGDYRAAVSPCYQTVSPENC